MNAIFVPDTGSSHSALYAYRRSSPCAACEFTFLCCPGAVVAHAAKLNIEVAVLHEHLGVVMHAMRMITGCHIHCHR